MLDFIPEIQKPLSWGIARSLSENKMSLETRSLEWLIPGAEVWSTTSIYREFEGVYRYVFVAYKWNGSGDKRNQCILRDKDGLCIVVPVAEVHANRNAALCSFRTYIQHRISTDIANLKYEHRMVVAQPVLDETLAAFFRKLTEEAANV